MSINRKKAALKIDLALQKLFLYWTASSLVALILCFLFYWTSLDFFELIYWIAYWVIILSFLTLPIFGFLNMAFTFFYHYYGSYSEKIKNYRIIYNAFVLLFLLFVIVCVVASYGFSFSVVKVVPPTYFLVVGYIFALAHSYITFKENEIRRMREIFDKSEIYLF